jgi:two-component system, OmpR family, sensor kinase
MPAEARPGWGRPVSARVRILVWVSLLLVLAGAVALLVQRRVLLGHLEADVAASLEHEVEELTLRAAGWNRDAPLTDFFDTYLRQRVPQDGEVLLTFVGGRAYKTTLSTYSLGGDPTRLDLWRHVTQPTGGTVTTPDGPARFLAVPILDGRSTPRGVFVVANFVASARAEVEQAIRVGAAVYGAVLLAAIGLAWLIAGRILAPVREVTRTARGMTDQDLSRRIPVPSSRDEVAELARTFNGMLDRLETAFNGQRAFLDDVGHELRTPVTIIRGHLEVEADHDSPEERKATRRLVLDELDRMGRIVEDLLILARAERPDFLRLEAVDLDLFASDLFAKARALGERDWKLVGTGCGVITADRHRLAQAVVNLLDNAARHTEPGASIEFGSAYETGQARLWVRDNGPGVAPSQRDLIFTRATSGSGAGSRAGNAGLGLAIARTIAEAHGGRVELHQPDGGGAEFVLTIPTQD